MRLCGPGGLNVNSRKAELAPTPAFAGAMAGSALALGVSPQPAAAQYAYDYGCGYPGPAYPTLPNTTSSTAGATIGAPVAIHGTGTGTGRTGVTAIGVVPAKIAGVIAAGQTKAVAGLTAVPRAALRRAAVPA